MAITLETYKGHCLILYKDRKMFQQEQKGEIHSTAALNALEESIRQLTYEFQGDNAFNFSHEMELASFLLLMARQKYTYTEYYRDHPVYIARLEWPCLSSSPRKRIDIVLWEPGSEKKARSLWGTQRGRMAKQIPLLAAVQIKRGGGEVTPWHKTNYDLKLLQSIHENKDLGKPVLYFLEWVDTSIRRKENARRVYREIKPQLINWCNESPEFRRVCVISRDRVGFVHPIEAWSVNPLPDGTLTTV